MKLKVLKNEISTPILNFYEQLGVKDIVEEMEYAAFPTEIQESSPAFMINVITQEKGAMGLNIGIQAGGGSAINTNAPIQMAFVGSTENCR